MIVWCRKCETTPIRSKSTSVIASRPWCLPCLADNDKRSTLIKGRGDQGGGSKISRVFIPISSFGSVYSVTAGFGGSGRTSITIGYPNIIRSEN